jgi:DNA-binding response OmpR family regulator
LDALETAGADAVLLDLTLPDAEGLDSVRSVRAASPETPIIVLTGLDSEEIATTAVKEGAQDYLTERDITRDALLRCVRYAIGASLRRPQPCPRGPGRGPRPTTAPFPPGRPRKKAPKGKGAGI